MAGADERTAPVDYGIEQWDAGRARDLAALVDAALPGEELSEDELVSCCWDDPAGAGDGIGGGADGPAEVGAVLAIPDGTGAAAVVWRPPHALDGGAGSPPAVPVFWPGAFVKLVAVHPGARREGRGHALLAAAEAWAWDLGATELRLEGSPPFYLWPGVDAMATEALCLAEARGYEVVGTGMNLSLPTSFRARAPEGVDIRRVLDDTDRAAVEALVAVAWPQWRDEALRAVEHGCCHAAFVPDNAAVGFVCHSVSRAGWLGPMGTDPTRRSAGIGRALLSAVCRDLMIAEMPTAEICWAGPLRFYAKCGATVSRVFRQYRKPRP
jgi:GNAT superfamily N-acetyltransferase